MMGRPGGGDERLLAAQALDEFLAQTVQRARQAGLPVPAQFFDWAAGDATQAVQRLASRHVDGHDMTGAALCMALRCAVRHWTAPWIVARFAELRPLFPELAVQVESARLSVLLRTGRWRCKAPCAWKLCEAGA